jgi:hypothetical protein
MRVALMISCLNTVMLPDRQAIVVRADPPADVSQPVVEHDRP